MVRSLDKKWKEFLYAFSGFGPNFLMVLMGAYFTNAINPAAMGGDTYQVIMKGTCFILPAIFPILYALAKAFDGIIDIPFAHITDTLSTRWGRRRPPIALCFIPMVVSYAFCWWPIGGADGQLLNTVWIIVWALVFFSKMFYVPTTYGYFGAQFGFLAQLLRFAYCLQSLLDIGLRNSQQNTAIGYFWLL